MKKMMIFAIAALSLTMAACNGKKAEQPQTATTEVAVVTDRKSTRLNSSHRL